MNEQIKDLKNKISNSKNRKIILGVIPNFSLYKLHEKKYINESVVLVIENNTSILLEEIYTEDFIVSYGDKNKFKNTKQVNAKSLKDEKIYIQTPPCDTYNFLKSYFLKDKLHIDYVDYYETMNLYQKEL